MSFAVWHDRPPFVFGPNDKEQIYQVGNYYVVTDQGLPTQQQIDAVLAPVPPKLDNGSAIIAGVLVKQGTLTQAEIDAALATTSVSS